LYTLQPWFNNQKAVYSSEMSQTETMFMKNKMLPCTRNVEAIAGSG